MNYVKKTAVFLTATLLGCCALTGCGGNGVTIAEEDMPYGATMREAKTTYALPVTYDRRFLNEEQLTAVTDYLSAIITKDAALYETYTLGFYNDYQLDMYSEDYENTQDLVDGIYDGIVGSLGENVSFNMITIEEFTDERVASGLDTILEILETIDEENEFVSTVDNCWALEMQWIVNYDGGSAILESQKLFLLEIDGKYYCQM